MRYLIHNMAAMAVIASMGAVSRSVDTEGVTYRKKKTQHGFFTFENDERVVPSLKATDADLFGKPKGKRAKRRHSHGRSNDT